MTFALHVLEAHRGRGGEAAEDLCEPQHISGDRLEEVRVLFRNTTEVLAVSIRYRHSLRQPFALLCRETHDGLLFNRTRKPGRHRVLGRP